MMYSVALLLSFAIFAGASVFLIAYCQMEKPEDLLGGVVTHPQSIAVDSAAGRLILVDIADRRIVTSSLAGEDLQGSPFQDLEQPHSIAVDVAASKLYWTDEASGKVRRATFDDQWGWVWSMAEDVVVGLDRPAGIAVVPAATDGGTTRVIWANRGQGTIQTASVPLVLSASVPLVLPAVTNISVGAVDDVYGVAANADYVYWTLIVSGKIQRAAVDGTGSVRTLVEDLGQPEGVALTADAVYWSDSAAGTISRASTAASIAGANLEFVVVSTEEPRGLAFDGDINMYWGDSSANVVKRTDTDGECLLVTTVQDEMTAMIILGCALGVATIACCMVCGCMERSRRSAKNSPKDAAAAKADGVVPAAAADGDQTAVPVKDEEDVQQDEASKDASKERSPAPPTTTKDQDAALIHDDKEAGVEIENISALQPEVVDLEPKQNEGPSESKEPELEMPNRDGKKGWLCCAA